MGKPKQSTRAQFARFLQPMLDALRELGGSGRPAEVKQVILKQVGASLPADFLSELNKSGETKFSNQVDWARFYLVRSGYVDSSKRGVWALTDKGRTARIDGAAAADLIRDVTGQLKEGSQVGPLVDEPAPDEMVPTSSPVSHRAHRQQVLELIRGLPPKGFEQLTQRLLRESGFESVSVTGRSGDNGIDGHGILQLNPFVSVRVMFQCKKYVGSVGAGDVRDFRGALSGRAEKGLFITTGTFTQPAEAEAGRDGAQPIELVDGEKLVGLLESLELGLIPRQVFEVDSTFFEDFRNS